MSKLLLNKHTWLHTAARLSHNLSLVDARLPKTADMKDVTSTYLDFHYLRLSADIYVHFSIK